MVSWFTGTKRSGRALAALFAALLGVSLVVPPPSAAQDVATLGRLLHDAQDFRVRVQAAFALGNTRDPASRAALEQALADENEAVRAAAATALGRLGERASLPALRRAVRDRSPAVRTAAERAVAAVESGGGANPPSFDAAPAAVTARGPDWRRVRAGVVLGAMSDRSGFDGPLAPVLDREVSSTLSRFGTIAFLDRAPALDPNVRRELERRRLPVVRVDGNVVRVNAQERSSQVSVRCEVSLTLVDEPGGNLRGMMQGAATGIEDRVGDTRAQRIRLAEQALAGAVRSALSSAEPAILRASSR